MNLASAILAISMATGIAQCAQAQSPAATKPEGSPAKIVAKPPYRARVFWGKILDLVKQHIPILT